MRIRNIKIVNWRHFQDIELQVDDEARLVCVVGANGTGKSHLLELIAGCAHRLGLSQGIDIPRGDPFADPHEFSLQFFLAKGVSSAVEEYLESNPAYGDWDRTLTIHDIKDERVVSTITAGGISPADASTTFASQIVTKLRESKAVNFLSLDADRAYPQKTMRPNDMANAYEIDWEGIEYTRGRSYKTSTTLYDEWIKYFLARENSAGVTLMQVLRRAHESGEEAPIFHDHTATYKEALRKVLPHVVFSGVDPKRRTLLFDTTGLELSFGQLSGGEREIAFLLGQIDRFGLRQGLFLLDEPELHLNADLLSLTLIMENNYADK